MKSVCSNNNIQLNKHILHDSRCTGPMCIECVLSVVQYTSKHSTQPTGCVQDVCSFGTKAVHRRYTTENLPLVGKMTSTQGCTHPVFCCTHPGQKKSTHPAVGKLLLLHASQLLEFLFWLLDLATIGEIFRRFSMILRKI